MENNNGKGIFYGVIGVATLVVAIIGATFAYFSATATNDTIIKGNAAQIGLSLDVTKVSTDAAAGLIPMNDADVSKGLAGDTATESKMCVDKNGNTVCQVYQITVTNNGTATAVVNGTLNITGATFDNLKWQLLNGTASNSLSTTTTYNPISTTTLDTGASLTASGSKTYFVMIWISNLSSDQSSADTGSFTGSVTFNSADGAGVSATFSS